MHVLMYVPPDLNPSDSLIASPYSVFRPPKWGGSTCIQHTHTNQHHVTQSNRTQQNATSKHIVHVNEKLVQEKKIKNQDVREISNDLISSKRLIEGSFKYVLE